MWHKDITKKSLKYEKTIFGFALLFLIGLSLGSVLDLSFNLPWLTIEPWQEKGSDKPFFSLEDQGIKIGTNTIRISRFRLDMGNLKIVNLADPVNNQDAATKAYVDAASGTNLTLYDWFSSEFYISSDTSSYKRVFVTSATYTGNLGGLTGADAKCQSAADNAGLGGTWKAWISDTTTYARDRISPGIYLLVGSGHTYADGNTYYELILLAPYGRYYDIKNPIDRYENGNIVSGSCTWTGTRSNGTSYFTCDNWTSDDTGDYGYYGIASSNNDVWTSNQTASCNNKCRLYCFEI